MALDGRGRPSRSDDDDVFTTEDTPEGAHIVADQGGRRRGSIRINSPLPPASNVRAQGDGSAAQARTREERVINLEHNKDAQMEEAPASAVVQRWRSTQSRTRTSQPARGTTPRQSATSTMPHQQPATEGGGSGSAAVVGAALQAVQPHPGEANVAAVAGNETPSAADKRGRSADAAELYNIIHETREYFVNIASGLPLPKLPRSVTMPKSNVSQIKLTDPGQLQEALSRVSKVKNVALRVLHGWVFKSRSRARGYTVAFQYTLQSIAIDITRAMWHGEDSSDVISPAICTHTLDMRMDLPLWFAGAHVEDRLEDDDMAAYQEATIMRLVGASSTPVETGQTIDGGCITHDRLPHVADSFTLLLAACDIPRGYSAWICEWICEWRETICDRTSRHSTSRTFLPSPCSLPPCIGYSAAQHLFSKRGDGAAGQGEHNLGALPQLHSRAGILRRRLQP
ncbi:hypothetical protein CBR_g18636 [Chara braunii]|uniref:Uncharacterized protein n=1 Tax=Chara braunii TaxID=69332 RepID=A0A388JTC6_CHABU|nr:hypothetical protein CBR_g18636 [Chara braunii]|eukprot:GBG61041.1 hypothetical protein CBR_g18636 [Chara braunii]